MHSYPCTDINIYVDFTFALASHEQPRLLTTFPALPRLPAELRLKIWYFVCSPRDVEIVCEKGITTSRIRRQVARAFTSTTPTPIATRICHESRTEALQRYQPMFRTENRSVYTYICFENDNIKLADYDIQYLGQYELENIRMMKVHVKDCVSFVHHNMEYILQMKNLKELEIIVDEATTDEEFARGWGRWYPEICAKEFEEEQRTHPDWDCPNITIVGSSTGRVLKKKLGGALIPGWQTGDTSPKLEARESDI